MLIIAERKTELGLITLMSVKHAIIKFNHSTTGFVHAILFNAQLDIIARAETVKPTPLATISHVGMIKHARMPNVLISLSPLQNAPQMKPARQQRSVIRQPKNAEQRLVPISPALIHSTHANSDTASENTIIFAANPSHLSWGTTVPSHY